MQPRVTRLLEHFSIAYFMEKGLSRNTLDFHRPVSPSLIFLSWLVPFLSLVRSHCISTSLWNSVFRVYLVLASLSHSLPLSLCISLHLWVFSRLVLAHCRWEFELKTGSDSGMLLYNTGHASYADYLGIELHNGNIRVLMNKGNGPSELTHTRNVTDGKWHRVSVDFNPSMITIKIDELEKRMTLPSGGNRYLDLAETIYIGGTELNKRARAIAKGLNSGHKSYKGCLRDMTLDGKPLGLPDVKVSQGIVAGCVWRYPCFMDKVPCRPDSICQQIGVASFDCKCDQRETCVRDDYVDDHAVSLFPSIDSPNFKITRKTYINLKRRRNYINFSIKFSCTRQL